MAASARADACVSGPHFESKGRLSMKYAGLVLILAVTAMGCDRSRAHLTKALAESQAAEAQKDSLLTEVLETTQFVSDLNSELAKAKVAALEVGEERGVPGAQRDKA